MMRTPAGRTSSVKTLGKVFLLQTEFLIKPRMRIVTSVALEGQVIHKVERTFDSQLETDEDLKQAESAVVAQHQNIARKIQTNGAEFIKQTRSIKISPVDRLTLIPGVTIVSDIEEKLAINNPHDVYKQSKSISDIADAITVSTKVGPLKAAAIISEDGKFILSRAEAKTYLLSLKPDSSIREVLGEVMKE